MSKKTVPYWRLNKIAEELDGEVQYSILLDSRGVESKRITITYKEEDDSSNLQQR